MLATRPVFPIPVVAKMAEVLAKAVVAKAVVARAVAAKAVVAKVAVAARKHP